MSVSSGSDITIPIQDSPPPPPSPYAGGGGAKGNEVSPDNKSSLGVGGPVTIIDTSSAGDADDAADGKKTPEPRGDVTVTVGFVNEAYQDTSPEHHNNHPHSEKNGHSKMTNGQKKSSNGAISITVPGEGNEKGEPQHQEIHLNEAVNPELINMNILNTIPDKPNTEYGPYDNLDEYFVPVNQHKKFLRSEKLYVTKDKRKETHWKKYICWLLGASILAAIVTVAVLAGIGLIPQKSPNHFESVVGTPSATSTSSGDLTSEDVIIPSSPESSLPSSTEINTPPSVPANATYVPMAADIHFHIKSRAYEPALNDRTSEGFQQLANEVQDEVKDMLRRKAGLGTVYTRAIEFAPGSVFVKMRIGWLDQATNLDRVRMALSNVTTVGQYDVTPISTYDLVNLCKFNKNGCSHNCSYDYAQSDFLCSCGDDNTLELAEDKKTCRSIYDVTSSTTSAVPLLPEFSSFSPSPVSEEESSPAPSSAPSTSSEEAVHEDVFTETHRQDEQELPPSSSQQPEEEHVHNHHTESEEPTFPSVTHEEPETSTEADILPETYEPVSHEQPVSHEHFPEHEVIPVVSTTTTTTTTEVPAVEPVSEEVIVPEHNHEHEHQPVIVPVETTTPSVTSTSTLPPTPEPLPILVSSSEETHHQHQGAFEEETTQHPSEHLTSLEAHSQEGSTHGSNEQPSVELGRTDIDEVANPTEPVPPQELPEVSTSSEKINPEAVRDVSSEPIEDHHVRIVPPTVIPESQDDEIETTVSPASQSSEEQHIPAVVPTSQEVHHSEESPENTSGSPADTPIHEEVPAPQVPQEEVKPVEDDQVAATVPNNEETQVATTALPEAVEGAEGVESDLSGTHDITPMDVLSFHQSSTSEHTSSTTPTPVSPVHGEEQSQGRSVSGSTSAETSAEVETIAGGEGATDQGSVRLQNLTEDDNESATESNRAPRLLSTEIGDSVQSLDDGESQKDNAREPVEIVAPVVESQNEEELPRPSANVTETASVETADENPEIASAVTKTSPEDVTTPEGASREAATQPAAETLNSENSQSGSSESNNNVSQGFADSSASVESNERSQESPVVPPTDSDIEERTTFAPLSLHHDIDINYLPNNTADHVNSEPVLPEVETVENDHVATNEAERTSDKLVVAPEDDGVAETTIAPVPVEREELANQPSEEETPEVPETPVISASGESNQPQPQEETPANSASVESVPSEVDSPANSASSESNQRQEETPANSASAENVPSQDETPIVPTTGESDNNQPEVPAISSSDENSPRQDEIPQNSESSESGQVQDETLQSPASGESSESEDETTGTTTRGITTSAEIFGSEESLESPNRDHRDANSEIETPVASREVEPRVEDEEVITTEVPLTSSSSTTTTTTTSSTSTTTTTTTTTAAPVVEAEVLTTVPTSTTTTTTPASIVSTNDTVASSNVNSDNSSSSVSQESVSQEESSTSSHVHSHEAFPASSTSYETGSSLESHHDSSSSKSDDDLHHNELT